MSMGKYKLICIGIWVVGVIGIIVGGSLFNADPTKIGVYLVGLTVGMIILWPQVKKGAKEFLEKQEKEKAEAAEKAKN